MTSSVGIARRRSRSLSVCSVWGTLATLGWIRGLEMKQEMVRGAAQQFGGQALAPLSAVPTFPPINSRSPRRPHDRGVRVFSAVLLSHGLRGFGHAFSRWSEASGTPTPTSWDSPFRIVWNRPAAHEQALAQRWRSVVDRCARRWKPMGCGSPALSASWRPERSSWTASRSASAVRRRTRTPPRSIGLLHITLGGSSARPQPATAGRTRGASADRGRAGRRGAGTTAWGDRGVMRTLIGRRLPLPRPASPGTSGRRTRERSPRRTMTARSAVLRSVVLVAVALLPSSRVVASSGGEPPDSEVAYLVDISGSVHPEGLRSATGILAADVRGLDPTRDWAIHVSPSTGRRRG